MTKIKRKALFPAVASTTGVARDAPPEKKLAPGVIDFDKCRTSMDCSPQTLRQLNWLGEVLGKSKAGVVTKSLSLYHQLATMHERGQQITVRDASGSKSMILPTLAALNSFNRACDKDAVTRLAFEVPARGMHELEELRAITGEAKKADVIRQAIHLTWSLLSNVEKGYSVYVTEENGEEYELFAPAIVDDVPVTTDGNRRAASQK